MTIENFVSCLSWFIGKLLHLALHCIAHVITYITCKITHVFCIILHDSTWDITQVVTWNFTRYYINVINVFTGKASQILFILLHGITLLITSLITWQWWHLNCRLHKYYRIHFIRYYIRLYMLYCMLYYMSLLLAESQVILVITCILHDVLHKLHTMCCMQISTFYITLPVHVSSSTALITFVLIKSYMISNKILNKLWGMLWPSGQGIRLAIVW